MARPTLTLAERPDVLPITATVNRFKELSGLSHTTVYALLKSGAIRSVAIGRRRLIILDSYRELLERSESQECSPPFVAVPVKQPPRDGSVDGSIASVCRKALVTNND